ncbi:MAG: toxin-antitoxin system HicB family antitoxin [Planctomycetota bacterium]|nr:toxin-antitoxin system HicB family antitoxin [Planctomycetota bacterium]
MNESSFSSTSNKNQEALQIAKQLFMQTPDWVTFFREILGIGGVARRLFATQEEFLTFEQSAEFSEIQNMVAALRNKKGSGADGHEPTRVITVRLPKSLHEALRAEAHDHKTSMNKLCIAKLLQVLEEEGEVTVTTETVQPQYKVQETELRAQANPVQSVQGNSTYSQY